MLEGRPNNDDEISMLQRGVVVRVEGKQKAGTLEEQLPPEEVSWQKYIRRTAQGTHLSIGLLNRGARGRTPAYLWVIGMAVCGDRNEAALATI